MIEPVFLTSLLFAGVFSIVGMVLPKNTPDWINLILMGICVSGFIGMFICGLMFIWA